MKITIEEMYDNFKYLEENYSLIQKEHPKLINAFNILSAMLCMHMPEHDTYGFAFRREDILEFIYNTLAVYSCDSKKDMLAVNVYARPKESIN